MFKIPHRVTQKSKGLVKHGGTRFLLLLSQCYYSIPLPYVQGLSEQLTHVFRKRRVEKNCKPVNTIRQQQTVTFKRPHSQGEELRGSLQDPKQGLWKRFCQRDSKKFQNQAQGAINNSRRVLFTAVDEHFKDTGHTLGMSSTTNITERPLRQYQAPAS